jgi:hypothetical protein
MSVYSATIRFLQRGNFLSEPPLRADGGTSFFSKAHCVRSVRNGRKQPVYGKSRECHKSCDGRDDLLSIMVKLNRQAKEEDNKEKTHIAEILAMLAGAIQEGQLQSFAKQVTTWGKTNLKNWKKIEKG